jgi:hypothetical protein
LEQQLNPGAPFNPAPSHQSLGQHDWLEKYDQVSKLRAWVRYAAQKFISTIAGEDDSISMAFD